MIDTAAKLGAIFGGSSMVSCSRGQVPLSIKHCTTTTGSTKFLSMSLRVAGLERSHHAVRMSE